MLGRSFYTLLGLLETAVLIVFVTLKMKSFEKRLGNPEPGSPKTLQHNPNCMPLHACSGCHDVRHVARTISDKVRELIFCPKAGEGTGWKVMFPVKDHLLASLATVGIMGYDFA